jgi:hypothetical protein
MELVADVRSGGVLRRGCDGDAGVVEVEDVRGPGKLSARTLTKPPNDAATHQTPKPAVHRVLGHEPETVGDLSNARLYHQLTAMVLRMREEVVQDRERFRTVLLEEPQSGRVAVLDPNIALELHLRATPAAGRNGVSPSSGDGAKDAIGHSSVAEWKPGLIG